MGIRRHGISGAVCAGMLSIACGLAAGCAVPGSNPLHTAAKVAPAKPATQRYCAVEINTPTPAEIAAINRYWTPLARSAVTVVDQGKMAVSVPKKDLSPAQRSALHRAEWAWQAFGPKPRLVCERISTSGVSTGAPAVAPKAPAQAP
jgi:uncharacterized membrane protein